MNVVLVNVAIYLTAGYESEQNHHCFVLTGPKTKMSDEEIQFTISRNSHSNGKIDFEYSAEGIARHAFETRNDFTHWISNLIEEGIAEIDIVDTENNEVKSISKLKKEPVTTPWFAIQEFLYPFIR